VLGGWVEAAVLHRAPAWAAALWQAHAETTRPDELGPLSARLLPLLPRERAEALVVPVIADGLPPAFPPLLAALPLPWGEALATTFLQTLARGLAAGAANWQEVHAWRSCLERAAVALPAASLTGALAVAGGEVADSPAAIQIGHALDAFRSVLDVRQRIHQETRP
jgi:hypothetical protein